MHVHHDDEKDNAPHCDVFSPKLRGPVDIRNHMKKKTKPASEAAC
jgi:hypothetical protein